jgi:beta-glucanase (GH16 family)
MKRNSLTRLVLVTLLAVVVNSATAQVSTPGKWKLVWRDEFNASKVTPADTSKWTHEIGGHGWGNHELEYYTDRLSNSFESDGSLVIRVVKEQFRGSDNLSREYTSARLTTKKSFTTTYGRIEARIKLPRGQGIWPAFWMLGADIDKSQWPSCGEIDIMENIGKEPSAIHGTIHGPGYSGNKGPTATYLLPGGRLFADEFHVFAVEWEREVIRFYCDDVLYATRTPADLPTETKWVYDKPFFIILNVAVGGDWPGNADQTSAFPQEMLVDYVRVYERIK